MKKVVTEIVIHYSDGSAVYVTTAQLQALEALKDSVYMWENARRVYSALREVFDKAEV